MPSGNTVELSEVPLVQRSCLLRPLNPRHGRLEITLTTRDAFRFGRSTECQQSFPTDYRISKVHCSLLLDGGQIVIEDHSVNGTYVNSERVTTRRVLSPGDTIFLVIPDHALLSQAGYTGSLTQNFVGYAFDLVAVEEASLKVTRDATTTTTSQYEVGQTADAGVLTAAMLAAASDEQVSRVDSAAPAEAAIVGATSHGMVSRDRPPEAPSTHHSNTPPADVEHVSFAAWWLSTINQEDVEHAQEVHATQYRGAAG